MIDVIVKRCAGLDIHKMSVTVTVIVESDDGSLEVETKEFGTLRTQRRKLARWLLSKRVEVAAMESTGNYWMSTYRTLEGAGIRTQVANARHVKNVPGRKTDVNDSQWLASLARCGLLKSSFIPSVDLQEVRLVGRYRLKQQSMLASETNRMHKVLDDAGIRLGGIVSDIKGVSAREMIAGLVEGQSINEIVGCARGRLKSKIPELREALDEPLSERHRMVLRSAMEHIQRLEQEIAKFDEYLIASMSPYQKQWELLQTIPGVDATSAALIIAEIGVDMEHFGNPKRLASWAGMCPGNNQSGGKRKSGRTNKGNQVLRRLLCQVANAAIRTKSQFKGKYEDLVVRRGHKRTIIAIAHKILRVIFSLLRGEQPYHDPGIDYEALTVGRNAPRWIKALVKFGYIEEPQKKPAVA